MNLLRISFLLFFIMPTVIVANDGYSSVNYFDINSYKTKLKKNEFDSLFKTESDKKDFKKLRKFLNEKRDLENTLSIEMYDLSLKNYTTLVRNYEELIFKLDNSIKNKTNDSIELYIHEYMRYFDEYTDDELYEEGEFYDIIFAKENSIKLSRDDILEKISFLKEKNKTYRKTEKEKQQLSRNLRIVRNDISSCEKQIDYALAPEYEKQNFRKAISGYFSALIGFLLAAFFVVVYFTSTNNLSSLLLSGNGLQFITLFVLIIAIILFGILGILEGRELAAILSGISGYILGKGITPPTKSVPPTP